jgi:choline dehydrogenase-like flavoprotein
MINRLVETSQPVEVQDTAFAVDVLGRYICNTWSEAVNNGGVAFDAVVIGAGMFGAYCAEKMYRHANLRVLVLDAGSFLVSEHVQNLSRIGLNTPGAIQVASNAQDPGPGNPRERVWGTPWRSQVAFPGLAYCVGGRSLYFGGWAPRLTTVDLAQWPPDIAAYLQDAPGLGAYLETEREIGVVPATDYISGDLYDELHKQFATAITSGGGTPNVDEVNELNKGAPLAVQAAPPASGLFSFDKYSSAPLLTEAIREAADSPDWRRRLFLVPRAHVVKLHTSGNAVTGIEVYVSGQREFLNIAPTCAVVLALSTIETTRLALESFPTPLMGRNLMAHLRSNTTVRIKRTAFDPALPTKLEAAALLVRGSTPQGRFHLQVTAAAVMGANPEVALFRMIPDIELLDRFLASQTADWIVLTLRGIGEMQGSQDPAVPKSTGNPPSWVDLSDQTDEFGPGFRRAWVNLVATQADNDLWNVMDDAALALALKLAKDEPNNIEYFYKDSFLNDDTDPGSWHTAPPPRSPNNNRNDPRNKVRDGLGTTHHEAGTLWMGTDATKSVTDLDGRFHHIMNAYVAGPALFPTIGSANPSLTGLSFARKTALAIVTQSLPSEAGFTPLGNGGLTGWQMAGSGSFMELGANIIESVGGTGLLWFTKEEFADFILRVDWQTFSEFDNSGVYLRFPALGNDFKPADTQGYEVQIDERGIDPQGNPGSALHRTGAVYGLAPSSKPDLPRLVGQWNTFEIEARGPAITVKLNGQLVSSLPNGNRSVKGRIGLQNHHADSRVQFRNLRIKRL